MEKYRLSGVEELEEGQTKLYEFNDKKMLVYRLSDGVYATSSKCTHLFKTLEKGQIVEDKNIRCPLHRAEFDIRSGQVANWANFPPGIQLLNAIRSEKCLDSYPVEQDADDYFVILG